MAKHEYDNKKYSYNSIFIDSESIDSIVPQIEKPEETKEQKLFTKYPTWPKKFTKEQIEAVGNIFNTEATYSTIPQFSREDINRELDALLKID